MKKALVFWFTGLSGSGKTTIAESAKVLLEKDGYPVLILDGDDIRKRLHVDLSFTPEDIKKNNSLIVGLCEKYRNNYNIIFVPIISPYSFSRKQARLLLKDGFYEIYFSAALEIVMKRDTKGLYKKAQHNEIKNLIGYSLSNVYQSPKNPDYVINSGCESVENSVIAFYKFVTRQLINPVNI